MNIKSIDLNLLVYLNALLEEQSVSKAAERLSITQPAMSNALKRLRNMFNDPILVRTSAGMTPTEKARQLAPEVLKLLALAEAVVQPDEEFDPASSEQTFRIMASDYIEATLIAPFIEQLISTAPHLKFDILSPSDVSMQDIENGAVDIAINRFTRLPQAFHQSTVWRDNFCCLLHRDHPYNQSQDLEGYLAAEHIWASKTGWGAGGNLTGKSTAQKLGWVDEALWQLDQTRNIRVFTRHYMVAGLLARQPQLIATLPRRLALLQKEHPDLTIARVPFQIVPIEIKMAWSPLLQHSNSHRWLRQSLLDVARSIADHE